MSCNSSGGCPHRSVNINYTGQCTLCHPGVSGITKSPESGTYFPGKLGKEACPNCLLLQHEITDLESKLGVLEEELMRCRRK